MYKLEKAGGDPFASPDARPVPQGQSGFKIEKVTESPFQEPAAPNAPAVEPEKDSRPLPDYDFMDSVAHGLTFGFADEYKAGAATLADAVVAPFREGEFSLGDAYDRNLSEQRQAREQYGDNSPVLSTVGEIAGGIAPALMTGGAVAAGKAGASTLKTIGTAAATGAGTGAVSGFGEGEGGLENRLENAAKVALVGGAIGGAAGPVVSGISKGAKAIVQALNPPEARRQAMETIAERALQDGMDPNDITEQLQARMAEFGNKPAVLADAGPNMRMEELVSMPGRTRAIAEATMKQRSKDAPLRVERDLRKAFDNDKLFYDEINEIVASRRKAAQPLYEEAYQTKVPMVPVLRNLFNRPALKQAYVKARRIAENEGEKLPSYEAITGAPVRMSRDEWKAQGTTIGEFGPVFDDLGDDWQGAVKRLFHNKDGEAIGVLEHPEIGKIDIPWGQTTDNSRAKGFGLSKLIKHHPEVIDDLPDIIRGMQVHQIHKGTAHLRHKNLRAAVRLDYDQKSKNWLVTAFEKGANRPAQTGVHASSGLAEGPFPTPPSTGRSKIIAEAHSELKNAPQELDTKVLDYIKRGLDDVLEKDREAFTGKITTEGGRAVDGLRRSFVNAVDQLNPAYKAARDAYAGPSQMKAAMESGKSFHRLAPEVIQRRLKGMSASERESYKFGALQTVLEQMQKIKDGTGDAASKIFKNTDQQQKLHAVLGNDDAFAALKKALEAEISLADTARRALGNSQTAFRQSGQDDLAGAGLEALDATQGGLLGILRSIMRGERGFTQEAADEAGRVLYSTDPNIQAEAIADIARRAFRKDRAEKLAPASLYSGSALAGGAVAPQTIPE